MNIIKKSINLGHGQPIEIETGKLAKQADGSVVIRQGDTMLLATVVANKEIKPDMDFLPMSVDYSEKFSSTGRFPGGYFKRDGRLNEYEILVSRVVDRSLRPLFPEDYHADIQVIISLISSDCEVLGDSLACFAASCALMCSDIPFPDPVSAVRVGYKDSKFLINPTASQLVGSDLDLMVSGTNDSIVMVEGEMQQVSEELMLEALKEAHIYIQKLNNLQLELRADINKKTREYTPQATDESIKRKVWEIAEPKVANLLKTPIPKSERSTQFKTIREELIAFLVNENEEYALPENQKLIKHYYEDLQYVMVRKMALENKRLDGRKSDVVRDIWCEVGYLPRAHGSAIFTRGETQSLSTITLGTKLDEQTLDYATIQSSKKFMLQYNFPPFSTGEIKPQRAPARREIGHGNLAERALKLVIPEENEYTIRVVSDVLESNGSSSMATVCAGCLALMDGGIKIKAPVSGIAMGLIYENGKFVVLSDILGDEDHLGDMDFKVTGTAKGLTACQMDIKLRALTYEILQAALEQSKKGRLHILNKMMEALSNAREDYSIYAPRLVKIIIPADKIGAVIGTGGKVIQEIQKVTKTEITIEEVGDKGQVTIASPDKECIDKALEWVKGIAFDPEIGTVFIGKVKNVREAGAFIEFMPGKEGWLHVSEVAYEFVANMESVMKVGDEIEVKYIGIDPKTQKYRLSKKALLEKPEGYVERPKRDENSGGGFNRDRDRRDDRRNDNRGRGDRDRGRDNDRRRN